MDRGDGRLERVGPEAARRQRPLHQGAPLRNQLTVPERAVLVAQQDELSRRRGARGAPRFVQQHQREQSQRLGLRQQVDEQTSQADRLAREVGPRQRAPRRRGIPLVEHEVDHVQHRVEPPRQIAPHRHLIGNARVPNLCLGAHDALGHRGRTSEKGAGDLLGREAADLAQGQRDLRVRRQSRMAAGEDQPQPIVLDTLPVPCGGVACRNVKSAGDLLERRVEPGAPAHCVDGLEAAGRHEPCPGIGGYAITRPPLYCCGKGIVQRFFGEVEVAEQADQGGEDAT